MWYTSVEPASTSVVRIFGPPKALARQGAVKAAPVRPTATTAARTHFAVFAVRMTLSLPVRHLRRARDAGAGRQGRRNRSARLPCVRPLPPGAVPRRPNLSDATPRQTPSGRGLATG